MGFLELIGQTINILLLISVVNLVFLSVLARASTVSKRKLKRKEYWFHIVCFNLAALLMYLMPRLGILTDQYFAVRFFVSMAIVYTIGFSWPFIKKFF